MKYWITKSALTDGIKVVDLPAKPDSSGYLSYIQTNPWMHHFYSVSQWHPSLENAKIRAEEMRKAKIASLQKQIAKLEKMTFA